MGRTMKWLKGFLGFNREKSGQKQNSNSGVLQSCLGHSGREATETDSLCENPNTIPPNITPAEAAWLRSFFAESDKEQSKHAIAVAAATAAAADAAVAAAHAAVAVVRLTSQGRGTMIAKCGGSSSRERWGAIKIQTVFRGYLARKALRALKGLVKLQALVRGYLVRKQAAATFQSMQALLRAQANIRAQRTNKGISSQSPFPARQSVERSVSFDSINTSMNANAVEESPKIVEMDTGRPQSRSRASMVSDSGDDDSFRNLHPPPTPPPPRFSLPERCCHGGGGGGGGDSSTGYSTAQSTPRIFHGGKINHHASIISPSSKSVCLESLFGNCPNYMADTQSFKAKLRSQSAPKQRHETKRRQSVHEMMGSRNSLSCVRSSCSHVGEALNFKNAVMSKLGRSTEFVRDQCRHCHMQE